jgi:hypothetical protein
MPFAFSLGPLQRTVFVAPRKTVRGSRPYEYFLNREIVD